MLDFTNAHFVDEDKLSVYDRELKDYISSNFLNRKNAGEIEAYDILPKISETYCLGSSSKYFNNAYVNNMYCNYLLTSSVNGSIGNTSNPFSSGYIADLKVYRILPSLANSQLPSYLGTQTTPWNYAYINMLMPDIGYNSVIGSSSYYWNTAYIENINSKYIECLTTETLNSTVYKSGRLYLQTANRKCELTFYTFNGTSYIPVSLKAQNGLAQFNVQGSFVPNSHATYDLGSTNYRWNIIYAKNGYATNGWSTSCDEKLKRDIKDVNVLDKLKNLRVKKFKYSQKAIKEKQWNEAEDKKMFSELSKGNRNYKRPETPKFDDDENSPDYIMAMAGEFNKAFGLDGDNEDTINYTNAIGVALRAIQELSEQVDELKRKLNENNKK